MLNLTTRPRGLLPVIAMSHCACHCLQNLTDENFGVTFRSFRNGLMDFERPVKAPLSDPIIKLDEPAVFFCDTSIPVYYSDPRNISRKEFAYVRPSIDRMLAMGHRFMMTPRAWAEFEKYEGVNIPLPDCFERKAKPNSVALELMLTTSSLSSFRPQPWRSRWSNGLRNGTAGIQHILS